MLMSAVSRIESLRRRGRRKRRGGITFVRATTDLGLLERQLDIAGKQPCGRAEVVASSWRSCSHSYAFRGDGHTVGQRLLLSTFFLSLHL